MSEQITLDGEYVTRDGREVRVICVDSKNSKNKPVIALLMDKDGYCERAFEFYADGRGVNIGDHETDLLPKPKKRVAWGWCYSPYRSIEELVERSGGCEVPVRVEFVGDKPVSIELAVIPAGLEAEGEGKA